ncbi:MAG TPA: universal stress protein [Vicinamibacterales bacterium]|nr:universal stress protein [Vicinamibacterales bacterium]
MNIRRILCPVDFSDASNHAVEHAVAFARWSGARLTLLHVYPSVGQPPTLPVPDAAGAHGPSPSELEALGDRVASMVDADAGVIVHASVMPGQPVGAIIEEAGALAADLVVMGTHGASGFQHLILGSVTEKVLRKAPCPVLTVPLRPVSTSTRGFTRVLCAVDFSDCSQKAVALAAEVAKEAGAALTLLHVIEWPWHEPPTPGLESVPPERARALMEYRHYLESSALSRLEEVAAATVPGGPAPAIEVRFGKPYIELLAAVGEQGADLIVIGVRGRGRLDLGFFGSTANQVVRQATCPVLTVRA